MKAPYRIPIPIFLILNFWTFGLISGNNLECISFGVLLTQNIENLGFHRDFKWLLEVTRPNSETLIKNKCQFVMELEMPQSVFVNPDQLADLQRMGTVQTFIDGDVDTELIEHEATNHTVYVFFQSEDYTKFSISLPFHIRYHRAQITGGYRKIILPKPRLLVQCSQKEKKLCDKSIISAPCDSRGQKNCRWTNIDYEPLFKANEVLVPVGDLDHYPLVSIISLSIGCIGCIYIMSLLSMFSKSG